MFVAAVSKLGFEASVLFKVGDVGHPGGSTKQSGDDNCLECSPARFC
jgi:hypothetical protein